MPSQKTSEQRIESHNDWPKKIEFSAELEFQKKIAAAGGLAPFKTAKLSDVSTEEFHRYLGTLIDGLDALPQRPDYLFDHCFRIIDAASKLLTNKSKTTYAISEVYLNIFSTDNAKWTNIVNLLCARMPKSSAEYISRRLLDASVNKGSDANAIATRARKCLGIHRFTEITQKYSYANVGAPGNAVNKCASFLLLLLNTDKPLPAAKKSGSASTYANLDLTVKSNLLTPQEKLRLIMSLFLFTMRNERQHGSAVSPFRTSKATLGRYASYYYAMVCAYTISLGVISARASGSISATTIEHNVRANLAEFEKFFGSNAR
jgi:hypothetical protein